MSRHSRCIPALLTGLLAVAVAVVPAARGHAANSANSANSAHPARASMTPVRIAFSTWTGYGPLVVGVQRGLFKKYGLDVSYSVVEDPTSRFAAFRSGRLDGLASTVDTFARQAAQGVQLVQVLGIDRSVGGDGIVAKKNITSVKQLKGKTIAVNVGSTSEWFLDYVLTHNGLSVNDITIEDMPDSSVAGSTFRAGRVDVAVTWEPWLTRANKAPYGPILISTTKYPDIIVDALAFRAAYARAHPDVVRDFVKGYYDAVTYVDTHKSDALSIIGTFTGEKTDAVRADLTTVKLMNRSESKAYFGTAARPGKIYDVARQAGSFWLRIKKTTRMPDVNSIVDPSYLEKM